MLVLPWIAEDLWCDVGRTLGRNDWMSRCSSSLIPIIRSCPRPVKGQLAAARSKGFGTRDLWGFDWHLAARFFVPAEGVFGSWQAARKPQRSKNKCSCGGGEVLSTPATGLAQRVNSENTQAGRRAPLWTEELPRPRTAALPSSCRSIPICQWPPRGDPS